MSEEKTLELYPSNWLYNAGVIGFLRVLEWGMEEEEFEESIRTFFETGIFSLPDKAFEEKYFRYENVEEKIYQIWEWYFSAIGEIREEKKKKDNEVNLVIKNWGYVFNQLFRGLFNPGLFSKNISKVNRKKEIEKINEFFCLANNRVLNEKQEILKCSICGEKFNKESNFEKFYIFSSQHISALASSSGEKGMPNSFWNLNASMSICLTCTYLILHYPLAFTQTSDGEIFINTPDFRVMWYLNKFVREVASKETDARKLFGLSLMQWAIRINQTLGAWTMANIEVIRKKGSIIDHFELSPDVVGILMDNTVAWILTSLGQWKLLELVMRERWSELLIATYCAVRASLADEIREGHCIKKYVIPKSQKEKEKEKEIKEKSDEMFWKLPLLFARIKDLTMEDKMKVKSKASIVNSLKKEGEKVKDLRETFKNLAFRILELTRLGKINDAYQAIIRVFIASKKPIPTKLVDILGEEDIELQKSYIYAFLSGVLGNGKEGGEA